MRLDGVGRHRRRLANDTMCATATSSQYPPSSVWLGMPEQQAREIPRRDVERRPGHAVGVRPRGRAASSSVRSAPAPISRGPSSSRMLATIDSCVPP